MVLTTRALMLGAYSPYQKELFDRVLWMRETKGLTFKATADALVAEGYKAPRGGLLGAESVFSIYKKGVGRVKRRQRHRWSGRWTARQHKAMQRQ
jgi:hypothetical protein